MISSRISTYCIALYLVYHLCQADNDVIVEDLKIFVNDTEFFIKAIAYNPVPLGEASMTATGDDGGGYCSLKETMYGAFESACYDSDYFDGSNDAPGRVPAGPTNGWFTALWQRDFPLIKELGVNTLRLYNANPSTRNATQTYTTLFPFPYGKNHVPFMDMCQQYGFKVIFPLIGDESIMTSSSTNEFKRYLSWQIDEIGNHPALLMYTLGNELPLSSDPSILALVNEYIGFARSYMMLKWGRVVPLTSAVVDLPTSYAYLAENLDVDVFTTNAGYRGISFVDLWSGSSLGTYPGWYQLSCQYNIPVFIGEIGWQDADNTIMESIPNWFNQIWLDGINHIDQGCVGGTFFEYSDEPLKAALQQTMGVVSFEASVVDGVTSTQANAWNPDTAVIKEIFWYVANGTTGTVAANMNSDVFQIIGRSPLTLSQARSATSVCVAAFSTVSCPTSTEYYDCSGNGICNGSIGVCDCGVGWSGSDCSVAVCAGSSTCSGSGVCVNSTSPPICNCDTGFDGDYCQETLAASSCPIGSGALTACGDGNGVCNQNNWTCACYPGWSGSACTVPVNFGVQELVVVQQPTAQSTAQASSSSSLSSGSYSSASSSSSSSSSSSGAGSTGVSPTSSSSGPESTSTSPSLSTTTHSEASELAPRLACSLLAVLLLSWL